MRKYYGRKKINSTPPLTNIKLTLERFEGNPILKPDHKHRWETKAVFNPAAIYEDGKVHILYRAIGESDVSVLGYASSTMGCISTNDWINRYISQRTF